MHSTYRRASSLLLLLCYFRYTATKLNRPLASENGISKQLGSSYLNQQRPLWILEDQVPHSDYAESSYTTQSSPYSYRMQQAQLQQQQQSQQSAPNLRQPHQLNNNAPRQMHAMPAHQQQLQLRPQQPIRAPVLLRQQPQAVPPQIRTYKYSPHLHLPHRYFPLQRVHFQQRQRPSQLAWKQPRFIASNAAMPAHRRENYIPRISMPTFDSMPGDENVREAPVFIYTGPKGKLIMNTILTAPKYPMQEPVPGQVLYPPSVPIFRPKPIVERFRMPDNTEPLNLTLIPFYEHEAIDMRQMSRMLDHGQQVLNEEATTVQPAVVYAAPAAITSSADSAIASSATPAKRFRSNKAKHYSAYHSPNEVQWWPITSEQLKLATSTTTPFPLTAPSPPQNHRFVTELKESSTTTPSFANYKITYKSDMDSSDETVEKDELLMNGDQLEVIYVDESLEKPATAPTTPPILSSRYSLSNEYYAFPVFTLGKLLQTDKEESELPLPSFMVENTVDSPLEKAHRERTKPVAQDNMDRDDIGAEDSRDDGEDDVETWFILNSRYKGQHTQKDNEYRLSSKYIHTTDTREPTESSL